jgi:tetratricopeptide (TPR) repeat protein
MLQHAVNIFKEGKTEKAQHLFQNIIKIEPTHLDANHYLAISLQILGKLEDAVAIYKKTIKLNPEYSSAHQNLGNTLIQLKKFEEAELSYRKVIELDPDNVIVHFNLGNNLRDLNKLEEAELSYRKAIELKPDYADAYNALGNTLKDLNKLEEAELSYRKAIELNPTYAEAYHGLGNRLLEVGKFEEAELSYRKVIELDPDNADAHNALGNILNELEKYDGAVKEYSKVLELNPRDVAGQINMINILNFFLPSSKIDNFIIIANYNLREIKNNFSLKNGIKKNELSNFFKESNKVVKDSIGELILNKTQIYRNNSLNLGCDRHMKVFNKFNVIPKFCFSCFKIQIEPKNIIEFFKLFFIFDKIKIPGNNIRKCMIELRPKVSGTYKGLIYCSSIEEANKILETIYPIINRLITSEVKIKRGCSEYIDNFPNYKVTNKEDINFMEYKDEWTDKEKIFDTNNTRNYQNNKSSLNGLSISDVLIMNNWLNYAKEINDLSYKEICKDIIYSNYIAELISTQIDKRKEEFNTDI